jgi:hypothetical protein
MADRKIVFKGELDTDDVTEGLQDIDKESKKTTDGMSAGFKKVDEMLGGIPSKIQGGVVALGGFIKGMGTLRGAIMATGIGALIVLLGSLTAAFTTSEAGQNKWAKVMGVVGTIVGNFTDLLADLGEKLIWAFENPQQALTDFANLLKQNLYNRIEGLITLVPKLGEAISLLFQGEFKQAGKVAADAVGMVATGIESITDVAAEAGKAIGEMAKEAEKEAKQASRVADMRAKADRMERALLVERVKLEAKAGELRLKAKNIEEFTADERLQALRDAAAITDELAAKEEAYLTLRSNAQTLENSFSRSNKEALDAEAQAQANVVSVQVRRINSMRELQEEVKGVTAEIKAQAEAQKVADEEALQREKDRLAALVAANQAYYSQFDQQEQALAAVFDSRQQQELDAVARKYDQLAAYAEEHGYTITEINARYAAEVAAIEKKYADEAAAEAAKNAGAEVARARITAQQKMQLAQGALAAITALNAAFQRNDEQGARRAFKRNKALGLATAIIQTGQAVTGALTAGGNPVKLATGAQFVEAAVAAVAGAAQIATIARTKYEGGGSAPPPPPSIVTSSAGSAGSGTPNVNVGQFGDAWTMGAQRAYVISRDVSNSQQANQLVTDQATLG